MARRGHFGSLPRQAPDLTASIVSMYEQYESQRDKNIFDAWQNGGEFEGSKVTDHRMLQWFSMRRDQTSRQDPMWDYWNDQHQQTEFAIAEQKANLQYQREKLSNSGMAAFYRHWATKLPRASAAWRDLMTSAARFAKAARAADRANAAQQRAKEEQRRLNNVFDTQVRPGYSTMGAIFNVARAMGFLTGPNAQSPEQAYDFNFTATEAANFDELLAAVQSGGLWQGVSTTDLEAQLKAADPSWDGNLDYSHVLKMVDKSIAGYRRSADIAKHYGDQTTARKYRDAARQLTGTRIRLKTLGADLPDKYVTLRQGLLADLRATTDPLERLAIYDQYSEHLTAVAKMFGSMGDLTAEGQIINEAIGARGGETSGDLTYWENASGTSSGTPAGTGPGVADVGTTSSTASTEAQRLAEDRLRTERDATGLADGSLVYAIQPDSNSPDGETMVIIPAAGADAIGKGNKTVSIQVPVAGVTYTDAKGVKHTIPSGTIGQVVTLVPVVVTSSGSDTESQIGTGFTSGALPVPVTQTRQVGYRVDMGNGEILWATPSGPNGELTYSAVPPFIGNGTNAIHAQSLTNDGTYRVEYSADWINQHDANVGDPLSAILQTIPDPNDPTGKKTIDIFNPANVFNRPPATLPATPADFQPQPGATATPPTTPTTPSGGVPPTTSQQQTLHDQWSAQYGNQTLPDGSPVPEPDWSKIVGQPMDTTTLGGVDAGAPSPTQLPTTPTAPTGTALDWGAIGWRPITPIGVPGTVAPIGAPGGLPGNSAAPPSPTTPNVPGVTPGVLGPPAPTAQQSADAFNSIYYATLATHPEALSWANLTLARAASSDKRRYEWSRQDPKVLLAKMEKDDPRLVTDPAYRALVLGQMDVIRGAGQSGIDEANLSYDRATQSGDSAFASYMRTLAIGHAKGVDPLSDRFTIQQPDTFATQPVGADGLPPELHDSRLPTAPIDTFVSQPGFKDPSIRPTGLGSIGQAPPPNLGVYVPGGTGKVTPSGVVPAATPPGVPTVAAPVIKSDVLNPTPAMPPTPAVQPDIKLPKIRLPQPPKIKPVGGEQFGHYTGPL